MNKNINSKLNVGKEYFESELNKRIVIGDEIYNRSIQTTRQFEDVKREFYDWNDYNSEFLKQSFDNPNSEYKERYDNVNNIGFMVVGGRTSQAEELREFKDDVKSKVNNLKQLVAKTGLMKTAIGIEPENEKKTAKANNEKVFIVHGHSNEAKLDVARTIEKLGLTPIILHEQANSGKTVIEKFEKHSDVGYAIVLLTGDDYGNVKTNDKMNPRARQNVILELGFFIGKLGRNKVCPLYEKGVELPSDMSGILYTEIDSKGHWKISVAKELKAAGYKIDVNDII
ncbi:nucleotide-binding protein [uncultured Maribacter sp.]|uniref:nucleotide-binding protein n=1 Tax=uncultured Maribacter sp. TaxID=431308 RepID=UPI00260FAE45|nr:nucleotide-binding protein [uncultured Maribacter sp.]